MREVQLEPDLPAELAAAEISRRLLGVIEANLPGALAGEDPEALHDLRVSVRRTRSLQRELKHVFPPKELKRFRKEFRRLQKVTGPTRDLDVYLLGFGEMTHGLPDLERVQAVLEERRATERAAMEIALQSERTRELLAGWRALIETLPQSPVEDRPAAVRPIGDVAAKRIERVYREMVRMGRKIGDDSPHSALHDLRKKGKELRYLLEFFASLFPREVTKPMVTTLKSLQDTLGRFQDREVQADLIASLQDEIAAADGSGATLESMRSLIEQLHGDQDAARAEFGERFAAFSAREQRRLVKQTFSPD
jgi:CHAD domain-containing protein